MKKNLWHKYLMILLLPIGILLNWISSLNSNATERIYSNTLYKTLSQFISRFTGVLPFSLAEVLVVAFVVFILWRLTVFGIKMIKKPAERFLVLKKTFINALAVAGVIYFGFVILWGFNYNRLNLFQITGFEVRPVSVEDLGGLSRKLISRANELRGNVREDTQGIMIADDGIRGSFKRAYKGYNVAAQVYPELKGKYGPPKPVLLSGLMAYTSIWGIYFPFTAEPNVNIAIPTPMLASTACHEMAHQYGFAREDEANYISYLTCSMHPDYDFQYSGTLLALTYTMNALYRTDRNLFNEQRAEYSDGVKRDLQAVSRFNERYESPVSDISSKTNDVYLKANRQTEGTIGYSRVVELLLAEYRADRKTQ